MAKNYLRLPSDRQQLQNGKKMYKWKSFYHPNFDGTYCDTVVDTTWQLIYHKNMQNTHTHIGHTYLTHFAFAGLLETAWISKFHQ